MIYIVIKETHSKNGEYEKDILLVTTNKDKAVDLINKLQVSNALSFAYIEVWENDSHINDIIEA